jgi:hypothetical protein
MLFERQRRLLSLLDAIGEPVGHTDFQKLLFLYTQECESSPSYSFVPYKFGAFSFTSYADKRKLVTDGFLAEDDQNWVLTDAGHAAVITNDKGRMLVASFCKKYAQKRGDALIVEQYSMYPYYATRSEILDRLRLTPQTRAQIEAAKPKRKPAGIVTIGYEGRSLEDYLNELLKDGVTALCDVRRNPLSRKYGFSKSTLSKASEGIGIRYRHLPELGIASEERRNLETQEDYDALFKQYEHDLPKQKASLLLISEWLGEGERVALTCYEAQPEQCHRHCIADSLKHMSKGKVTVEHL